MNKTIAEARAYASTLLSWASASTIDATIFLLPPFTALAAVTGAMARPSVPEQDSDDPDRPGPRLRAGAQNMHWALSGPFTGEISAPMLRDCGADLVEIGHFERRLAFGETDLTVRKKVRTAISSGLTPIVCVGEDEQEHKLGVSMETVTRQIKIALHGLDPYGVGRTVVAYEPTWAIGTDGREADPAQVGRMHAGIRDAIIQQHGPVGRQVPLIYGGSVTAANAARFAARPEVDGLFIGRAAWNVESFIKIIESFWAARTVMLSRNGALVNKGDKQ